VGAERGRSGGAARIGVADDVEVARTLFREYALSLGEHAAYLVGFEDELAALPAGYDFVLVAELAGDAAGCVAVRPLSGGACEMKRLYVRPSARGTGAGRALAVASIERALASGYTVMRLDTLPTMVAAGALYGSLGFTEIERYNDNPAPGVRFMELRL
jgi:GNAT superfamily N-acetyltransferase